MLSDKTRKLLEKDKKNKRVTHETIFEQHLAETCKLLGGHYEKHKDPIKMKQRKELWAEKHMKVPEVRRPYDGELSTPIGNFPVELKYGDNWLSPHQEKYGRLVTTINKLFFILKKDKIQDNRYEYYIMSVDKKIIFTTNSTAGIYKWFSCAKCDGEGKTLKEYVL